jgi:phosphatidylglycerophosphate synthase
MDKNRSIKTSIIVTMLSLLVFQGVFFAVLVLKLAIKFKLVLLFFGTTALYHALFIILLARRADQFRIEPEGRQLSRVNLANFLTMVRLSSLPTICFLVVLSRQYSLMSVLLVFITVVFLTDLFDGALSRMTHQVTHIGKLLDSFSDYLVLMVISIAFIIYNLIPVWFFITVIVRGSIMITGMSVLTRRRGYLKPQTSFIGKASFFAIMVLYAYEILALVIDRQHWAHTLAEILEYIVGSILVVSIIDKVLYFASELKTVKSK